MGKYDRLRHYLTVQPGPRLVMDFDEIDELVEGLPALARAYREWWTNDAAHLQAQAWLAAGWMVQSVNLAKLQVHLSTTEASEIPTGSTRLPPRVIDPIPYLKRLLSERNHQVAQMIADRDSVLSQYGRLFHPDNLDQLGPEDVKGFLLYENNRHWWGIHRHQAKLISDMGRLRRVLGRLLDESLPIEERLDWIEPASGPKPQPGLGKAVFTPILHVVHPDRYGVWNSIAEAAMQRLGLWPEFPWGGKFGRKYVLVNDVIKDTAAGVGCDLWTIDSLWWAVEKEHEPTKHQFEGTDSSR